MKSKKIALCAMLCAVAIVIMMLASLIGIGIYAGPLLASIAFVPITKEYGSKSALLAYLAVALISILIMPDRELAFFFVCFGWYQPVLPILNKIKSKLIRIIAKLCIYFSMIYLMYGVFAKLIGIEGEYLGDARWIGIVLVVVGAFVFLLLDIVYQRFSILWDNKWRKRLLR